MVWRRQHGLIYFYTHHFITGKLKNNIGSVGIFKKNEFGKITHTIFYDKLMGQLMKKKKQQE